MKIIYISPSYIPSVNANSIHVINQCSAFVDENATVTLLSARRIFRYRKHYSSLEKRYGKDKINNIHNIKTLYYPFSTASTFFIGIYSFIYVYFFGRNNYILTRNLYAALLLLLFTNKNITYETHQLEIGIRKKIQKMLILSKKIKLVLISKELKLYLEKHHSSIINNEIILHDAAPKNKKILSKTEKNLLLTSRKIPFKDYDKLCGYFGQLYEGRGIEIIIKVAEDLPNDLFLIFGGNKNDIKIRINENKLTNLWYMGNVDHPEAMLMMQAMDILLMPYQEKVSIGQKGHDTSAWMSPMKMFEYMSSHSVIISSNHKVLKEVLKHRKNAFICDKNNYSEWVHGIKRLKEDKKLFQSIASQSYSDYNKLYTWNIRGRCLLKFIKN